MKTVLVLTLALATIGLAAEASLKPADFADLVNYYEYEAQMERSATRAAGEEELLVESPANYDNLASAVEQFNTTKTEGALSLYTQQQLEHITQILITTVDPDGVSSWETFIAALPDVGVLDVDDPVAQHAYRATVELLSDPDFQSSFDVLVTRKEQGNRGMVTGILIGWAAGHVLDYIWDVVTEAVQGAAESIQEAMQEADIDTTAFANQAPIIGTRGATLGAAMAISEWFD